MVKITDRAVNIRGKLSSDSKPGTGILAARKQTTADGVQVEFKVPLGYKAYAVDSAGLIRVEGELEEYTQVFNGFQWVVKFEQAPPSGAIVGIWPVGV